MIRRREPGAATGSLGTARCQHTATLLPSGKVLVAGGSCNWSSLSSAELYDPATGKLEQHRQPRHRTLRHTATLLPSGKVLVAGGVRYSGVLSSAELYDPATGTWNSDRQPQHRTLILTRRRCCPQARCWWQED